MARAYSQYQYNIRKNTEPLDFEEALDEELTRIQSITHLGEGDAAGYAHQHYSYRSRGRYAEQLKQWFNVFPRDRFLVLQSEIFFRDPIAILASIFDFLGLSVETVNVTEKSNTGAYPPLCHTVERRLRHYFKPLNEELYSILEIRDPWWKYGD